MQTSMALVDGYGVDLLAAVGSHEVGFFSAVVLFPPRSGESAMNR
jgi:hypothetical protein